MKRLTSEEVRVDESVDRYLGPLADLEGMKPKLLDLILNGPVLNGVSKDVLRQIIRQLYSALAAYEDTRLEPEEIDMDHEAAEQLRHLCRNCDIDRLEELAEADKDGRLVVLPCKVGDTVWAVSGKIIKCESEETYLYDGGGIEYFVTFDCDGADCKGCPFNRWEQDCSGERYCKCEYGCSSFKDSGIGKTVFFTHEEAEAALEAMKDV